MVKKHISDIFSDKRGEEDTSIGPWQLTKFIAIGLLAIIIILIIWKVLSNLK